MSFAEPLRLLALLVALPLLWWLSLPSRPRTAQLTPHLAQWQAALAALRRRPPRLARLRFLLLALAGSAAIAAFAGPVLRGRPGVERLVVVLDGSASMGARSAAGLSAWDRAQTALRAGFAQLPADLPITLLRAGGPLLRRHGAAARALLDLGEPAGSQDGDLATLAREIQGVASAAVWTLTDGQGGSALPGVGARTVLRATGPNAAVLSVACEDRWPLPGLELVVDVAAWTDGNVTAELVVEGALDASATRAVELAPGQRRRETFAVARAGTGGPLVVRVALAGDVLAADDAWRAELPPLPAPRIAVLADAEAGPYAAVAAAALAEEVGGAVVAAADKASVGVLLVDGGAAPIAAGAVRAITFGTRLGADSAPATPWRAPVVADWDRSGPLGAGLDLSDLRVAQAWRDVLPAGEPFLWADDAGVRTPLAVVAGNGDVASVHFAFRLQDANLPLLAAFPQLLRRAFVRSYGPGAAIAAASAPPPAGEQDLRVAHHGADVALPAFAAPDVDLSAWFLLAALFALALRAFVR